MALGKVSSAFVWEGYVTMKKKKVDNLYSKGRNVFCSLPRRRKGYGKVSVYAANGASFHHSSPFRHT